MYSQALALCSISKSRKSYLFGLPSQLMYRIFLGLCGESAMIFSTKRLRPASPASSLSYSSSTSRPARRFAQSGLNMFAPGTPRAVIPEREPIIDSAAIRSQCPSQIQTSSAMYSG